MVEILIPFQGGCPHRDRAFNHLIERLPYPIIVGNATPWSKGAAVWSALQQSKADVVVIHDADCWTDGLCEAVARVSDGFPWAIPHKTVYRLSESSTRAYMAGERETSALIRSLDRQPYEGLLGGGIAVLPREMYLDCPIDPHFVGWGSEDDSWGAALETLHGHPWRGTAPLWHLWHPPQARLTPRWGSEAARRRWQEEYHPAIGHPERMRAVIEEAKRLLNARTPVTPESSTDVCTTDTWWPRPMQCAKAAQ